MLVVSWMAVVDPTCRLDLDHAELGARASAVDLVQRCGEILELVRPELMSWLSLTLEAESDPSEAS